MGPPRDLAIRPLGLGEVIDRAVALTRRHFRPLFLAMLVVEAPAFALARVQQARTVELAEVFGDPARAGPALARIGASLAALLAVLLLLQLAAIVAPSLDPRGEGEPPAARRALAVATSAAVQLVALVLAPAAGGLPGLVL